jgi:fructose-1,6-bisphosphatase/inositol monophosphatase family enzyme
VTDGVDESLLDSVGQAIRDVAASAIVPRFRALTHAEVTLKGADDVVTAADLEAEALLTERLRLIRPGLPVLGEESSHSDSGLRARVESGATYWVVDPLDGTKEFVAGRSGFGVMVALVESGTTTASWIYLPIADRLYDAAVEVAVRRNGSRLAPTNSPPRSMENALGFALTRFAPPEVRSVVDERMQAFPTLADEWSGSAASAYAALLEGELDFGFYWRTEPWDHAPGAFLVGVAGGRCARLDGKTYSPGDDRTGLLVTTRRDRWAEMLEALHPSASRT